MDKRKLKRCQELDEYKNRRNMRKKKYCTIYYKDTKNKIWPYKQNKKRMETA